MALLDRSEWYDLARETTWTPRYVTEQELFPNEISDRFGLSLEQWAAFDEPYKVSYREYVAVQTIKDVEAYSVRTALARSKFLDQADPAWQSILEIHFGGLCLGEYAAGIGEAKMLRFGKAAGWRNMATYGLLDEVRHTQIQLYFAHACLPVSNQFDWALKALHTNNWVAVSDRAMQDDMITSRDAAGLAITLTFAIEQAFTNLQFLGIASDAAKAGDFTFSNMVSSVQTDEARHAQIGGAVMKVLIANGKKEEAQKVVDIAFWRNWRLFMIFTGPATDYLTPLAHRGKSFKEFVEEWIIRQFERAMLDLGLELPWYWDYFLESVEYHHHSAHLQIWYQRPTVWWDVAAGVSPAEREWLERKYPGWGEKWGRAWDLIAENVRNGEMEKTVSAGFPILCNICNLSPFTPPFDDDTPSLCYTSEYKGRTYHFCCEPCKWVFDVEPERYADHKTIMDRLLDGEIQPPTMEGVLNYFGMNPAGSRSDDAHGYAWARALPHAAE